MSADAGLRIFALDHPRVARTLSGKLRQRQTELAGQLATGNAQDWGDYRERVGTIRGFSEAIAMADQIAKEQED